MSIRSVVSRAPTVGMRVALGLAFSCSVLPVAFAQSADRERAQMRQMQQQMQRLQSDNAAMVQERNKLQDQVKEAESIKKSLSAKGQQLAKSQAALADATRDGERLRAELDAQREQAKAQIEQWQKAVSERDEALRQAGDDKRRRDAENALLLARLKAQTGRGDLCEVRHEQTMTLAGQVIDDLEKSRLGRCEFFTGNWKVREQEHIQGYRDRLADLRLEVPAAPSADAAAAAPPR